MRPSGSPDLRAVVHHVHARRHDADDFARQAVDLDRLADDVLAAERGLPQLVREDHDRRQRNRAAAARRRRRAGEIGFALAEQAPCAGCTPSARQQTVVHRRRAHAQRAIARGEVDLAGRERADRRKRLVDLAELEVFRRRHPELVEPERRELGRQIHQLLGLGIAERPQDHAVDDRENRGVRADAQRQREDRDDA